ncbi:MAG: 6-bladed beta-propeller [Gemmatimonadaceae bacterium]
MTSTLTQQPILCGHVLWLLALGQSQNPLADHLLLVLNRPVAQLNVPATDVLEEGNGVRSMAGGRAHQVYILDPFRGRIQVFDSTGHFVRGIGRLGHSPGEFWMPYAIATDDKQSLFVLDVAAHRVSRFDSLETGATLGASVRFGIDASAICTAAGRVYILGGSESTAITVVNRDGALLGGFGLPFGPGIETARPILGFGHLVCDASSDLVIAVSDVLGEVRGYNLAGRLLWVRVLDGMTRLIMEPQGAHAVRFRSPTGGYDRISALVTLSSGMVALQIEHRVADTSRKLPYPRTIVLSASNGLVLGDQQSLPPLVGSNLSLLYSRDPGQPAIYATAYHYHLERER